MNATPFDTRSSEWVGDMTVWLRENADDNQEQIDRLLRNLRKARVQELTPLLRDCRELAVLTARYYDRSYHKHERYTI